MEQVAGAGFEQARHTVITPAQRLVGAENIQRLFVKNKTRDKEIQLAVVVIIEPDGTGGPAGRPNTGFIRDIGEGAVAVVVIKNIAPVTGYVEIDPAIAIVITGGDTHAKRAAGHSGFVGHVCKRPIMIVVIKGIPQRLNGSVEVRKPAIDQIDIHPAIVVIIEKGTARPNCLRQIAIVRVRVVMNPGDAALLSWHFHEGDVSLRRLCGYDQRESWSQQEKRQREFEMTVITHVYSSSKRLGRDSISSGSSEQLILPTAKRLSNTARGCRASV